MVRAEQPMGVPLKKKAAGFEKAISFNLQEAIVLYEPASVEEDVFVTSLFPSFFFFLPIEHVWFYIHVSFLS